MTRFAHIRHQRLEAKPSARGRSAVAKPKTFVSIKADPCKRKSQPSPLIAVYEDEFEQETKLEAKEYATVQRNERDRSRIRAENKRRRKEGLEPLKLPPTVKSIRKRTEAGHSSEDEGQSHLIGSGDSDSWVRKSGARGKKARRGNEEDLSYEGRKFSGRF